MSQPKFIDVVLYQKIDTYINLDYQSLGDLATTIYPGMTMPPELSAFLQLLAAWRYVSLVGIFNITNVIFQLPYVSTLIENLIHYFDDSIYKILYLMVDLKLGVDLK